MNKWNFTDGLSYIHIYDLMEVIDLDPSESLRYDDLWNSCNELPALL